MKRDWMAIEEAREAGEQPDYEEADVAPENTFAWVLTQLMRKQGRSLRFLRAGWNGKGMHVGLWNPMEDEHLSEPYLFLFTVGGTYVPWVPSQTDMLATDWMERGEVQP